MYKANSHEELKKLLKENKFPIHIADKNTIKIVETMEELKKKGLVATARDKICGTFFNKTTSSTTFNVISETTVVALALITAASLISLYALYQGKNIKTIFNRDGTVIIESC